MWTHVAELQENRQRTWSRWKLSLDPCASWIFLARDYSESWPVRQLVWSVMSESHSIPGWNRFLVELELDVFTLLLILIRRTASNKKKMVVRPTSDIGGNRIRDVLFATVGWYWACRSFEFARWWWSPLPSVLVVGVLDRQTYQGGTRGSRLYGGGSWSVDQELKGMREDTGHKIYTGSSHQGGEPYVMFGD
jgi:hypothetical protein